MRKLGFVASGMVMLFAAIMSVPQATAQADLVAAAEREGTVVWYNVLPSEAADALAKGFEASYPKIKAQWVRSGTFALVQRYTAEVQAGRVQADVLQHNEVGIFNEWARGGLLMKYDSPEAKNYPADQRFQEYWTALRAISSVIAYNTRSATTPSSWIDLLDPKYKGRINMADPRVAGDAIALYWALRKQLGVQYWQRMAQQNVIFLDGVVAMAEQLSSGEKLIGVNVDYRIVQFRDELGAPLGMVYPKEGTIVIGSPVAIASKAPHPNAAKLFYNWLLSPVGQQVVVKQMKQISVRRGMASPKGILPLVNVKAFRLDWDEIGRQREALQKEFVDLFGLR